MKSSLAIMVAATTTLVACGARAPVTAKDGVPAPSATAAAPGAKPEEKKFDFEAYLKREIPPLPVKKVAEDVLAVEVETSGAPVVTRENASIHVKFPIGTEAGIDCFVYDQPKDGAATIALVVNEVRKTVDIRLFAPTDVFVAKEHAVLTAHALYLADQPSGVKAAGQLKLAYLNDPLTPALCMHDEAGFSAAFARITKRFFETAQRRDRELRGEAARSWEVSVVKLDGRPIGYDEHRTYEHVKTRALTSVSISGGLYPRSATDCRAQDSITTETTDGAGQLLELEHLTGSGEIELKVTVKLASPAHYTFAGEQAGKPISGKFQTSDKAGLATTDIIASRVKSQLLSGKATSFKVEEYVPSVDPTAPIEASYELESKDERRVRTSLGPIRMSTIVDEEGRAKTATANIGRAGLAIERLASGKR